MKWFQHQSNSHNNLKFQPILEEFGLKGYGMYWILCELVAEQGSNYVITSQKKWKQGLIWSSNVDPSLLDKMLISFADANLISKKWLNRGALAIPKMKDYSDNWTKRPQSNSVVTTQKLPVDKIRIDKIRIDKIREEEEEKLTPSKEMKLFIERGDFFKGLVDYVLEKTNLPKDAIEKEFDNFIGYWTERNKSGTKQRWELEKTFEIKRRLSTWFKNAGRFNSNKKGKTILI